MKHFKGAIMQNESLTELLKAIPLFYKTDEKKLSAITSASKVCEYEKGDTVSLNDPALHVVLSGSVRVYRVEGGKKVLLNTIKEKEVFGAAQLFCDSDVLSSVKAVCSCTCLHIPKTAVSALLKSDPEFTVNYVTFLSDRIRFLNKKIASLTAGNGEKTLAEYLISQSDGQTVRLNQNMSSLASSLGISRPTLYRAFISLQDQGIIEKNGKDVKIISIKKLKNI